MHKTDEVVITHFFVKSYKTTRTKIVGIAKAIPTIFIVAGFKESG